MTGARPVLNELRAIVPPLLPEFHKGQAGRVGIIGGCREYTGAPFFASMASMRLGCDMSFTICDPVAAPTIKSYSPDVIVHPVFGASRSVTEVRTDLSALFARLHSLVIGPGLGREPHMQTFAQVAIDVARARGLYLVLDADALWLLQNNLAAIMGYDRAVLTPNVVEFGRLCDAVGVDRSHFDTAVEHLAEAFCGPTILAKGQWDRIASPACVSANKWRAKVRCSRWTQALRRSGRYPLRFTGHNARVGTAVRGACGSGRRGARRRWRSAPAGAG